MFVLCYSPSSYLVAPPLPPNGVCGPLTTTTPPTEQLFLNWIEMWINNNKWIIVLKSKIPLSCLEEGLEVDVRIICLYLVFGMHGSLAYAYFKSIICGGAGKNGSTVAVRERSNIPLYWLTNWHWLEIYTTKKGTTDLVAQKIYPKKSWF